MTEKIWDWWYYLTNYFFGAKKTYKPDDWWCHMCNFKIFGTKDHCHKCGLLESQWCCKSCKYISDNKCLKCPSCGEFNSIDAQYFWLKKNNSTEAAEMEQF